MLHGFEDKTAYAETVFSFSEGVGKPIYTFVGRNHGKIVLPRGNSSFGVTTWDPIFEPNDGNGCTYAELSKEEKNKISHRRRSLDKLRNFLLENKDL